jgi:flagellar biosynthesis/type III secretory pathway chaperone
LRQWLEKNDRNKSVAIKWENLLSLAREAKLLNNINSRLVGLHLNQNAEALRALTRQPEMKSLYGSKGQAAGFSCSRIVDSA